MKVQTTRAVLLAGWLLAACWPVQAQESVARNAVPATGTPLSSKGEATPEEHFRLAEYLRDLATQEQSLARSYDHLAKLYQEKTMPADLSPSTAREIKNQLLRLAETERKAAAAAANLAGYHARLAERVEQFPVAARPVNIQDSAFRR